MSALLPLSLACAAYDRTRALIDGRVKVAGCEVSVVSPPTEEMFTRAFRDGDFDVSELSFGNFMRHVATGTCPYVGIPVFPSRAFRHSSIYVRADRGIVLPADLRGKRVGLREYSNTASLTVRGFLFDDYGVDATDIHWYVGDIDHLERSRIDAPNLPERFRVETIGPGRLLSDMLEIGDLDALIAYRPPRCYRDEKAGIRRLFPDYAGAERDYFSRTGIFPLMHLVGVKAVLVQEHPWIVSALIDAFAKAKDIALGELSSFSSLAVMLPWAQSELAGTRARMGDDFWPYGLDKNRAAIDALGRYALRQAIVDRLLVPEDMFARVAA